MRRPFAPVIFLIAILCAVNLQAQSYSSVHYDTKDGLPSSTVYDITQDKTGFIWFATENGLSRFDGKNFRTYTTRDGLPDNSVLKVHGDNTGKVFFTPFTHGLYFLQQDSIVKVSIPDKYQLDLSTISNFLNKSDKLIVGGIKECYFLDNGRLISLKDSFKTNDRIFLPLRVYDTVMIILTEDSLYYTTDSGRRWLVPSSEENIDVFDENMQMRRLKAGNKAEFIVREFFPGNLLYEYSNKNVNIFEIASGNLLYKIKVEKLSDAFIDNEKNLWISTLGNGVFRFPSFSFRNIVFDNNNEIFSLTKVEGRLLAGADFSKIFVPDNNPEKEPGYTQTDLSEYINHSGNPVARNSSRNRVYALRSLNQTLYIGTDAFLLKKTGTSSPLFRNIYPVKDMDIVGNDLLVCTGYGVLLLDQINLSVKDTLLKQRATCGLIYQGEYYIGTLGGLIKIKPGSREIVKLHTQFPAFQSRITAIKRGFTNDLWIATSGAGLIHFRNNQVIKVLKEQDGLTSDICTSLFIDSNLLWLGTNQGLNRIDISLEKPLITRFTSASGLGADFINTILADDSNVYVGTSKGLTIFNKNIMTEKSVCLLHVLRVSENNRPLKNDSAYSFPYNALNIRIDFTAISFKSAGDILYYYKLEGLDEEWNTTTANFINFASLPPDNYRLLLKATNKFGVESATRTLYITMRPPWWQTWFFRITVIIISGLLISLVTRYYIRTIKRKEATKREFETRSAELEQKALQAQMNPHFIFNSLNSIQNFILNLDVEGANRYLTSFASLIRQTLDNSMNPLITIASEIRYLETYLQLEKLRFREKFGYRIDVDKNIDINDTFLPGMLLQPYIENSIRHGIQHRPDNDGLIIVDVRKTADHAILYTIKDNGVGRKKAAELRSERHIEYQSRGTFINEKRIVAINIQFKTAIRVETNDILDSIDEVTGTMVTVLVPPLNKQGKI